MDGPGRARLIALGLATALGLGLGSAAVAAVLLSRLGLPLGVPAVALLLAGVLHPRGPAGRLTALFHLDPAAERHPLPTATTARTA